MFQNNHSKNLKNPTLWYVWRIIIKIFFQKKLDTWHDGASKSYIKYGGKTRLLSKWRVVRLILCMFCNKIFLVNIDSMASEFFWLNLCWDSLNNHFEINLVYEYYPAPKSKVANRNLFLHYVLLTMLWRAKISVEISFVNNDTMVIIGKHPLLWVQLGSRLKTGRGTKRICKWFPEFSIFFEFL